MGIYVYRLCSKTEAITKNKKTKQRYGIAPDATLAFYKYAGKLNTSFLTGYLDNDKIYNRAKASIKKSWGEDDKPDYIIYNDEVYRVNQECSLSIYQIYDDEISDTIIEFVFSKIRAKA